MPLEYETPASDETSTHRLGTRRLVVLLVLGSLVVRAILVMAVFMVVESMHW